MCTCRVAEGIPRGGREAWLDQACIGTTEEDRGVSSEVGQLVSVGPRNSSDQPMEAQAPEIVGHPLGRELLGSHPPQRRDVFSQIPVGETSRQEAEDQECAQQRQNPEIAEPQGRGPLPIDDLGTMHLGARSVSHPAVMAESLDVQETSVGPKAHLLQGREVVQPSADLEVMRIVDGRLRAQGAPLFVVLLDPAVLVIVRRRLNWDKSGSETRDSSRNNDGRISSSFLAGRPR